ncbi:MAG TPA: FHA domain-containing protein [Pyrinomonadaceae bacterium]|jgi:pSer/pThr/pTyr-binding forkhead associated (FHA) protein|nr:FHA domain-containing protein [Pyrinomonadaceae bacterium]
MTPKLLITRKGDAPAAAPLDELPLADILISIGSDAAATLSLRGAGIAPEQAVIINEDGVLLLINRADGTTLNDQPMPREARRPLTHGDRLGVGDYVIILVTSDAPAASQTGARPGELSESLNLDTDAPPQAETNAAPPQNAPLQNASLKNASPSANGNERPPRNFAAILDTLRTEEDSFYLLVEGGPDDGRRVRLESLEMPLGWEETGQRIAFEAGKVLAARAVLRKDWTGVVVQSAGVGLVAVNGEPVEAARQLRNGDRLTLVPTVNTSAQNQAILIFHEPASLIALDSLLPQKLPPPVALQPVAPDVSMVAQASGEAATLEPSSVRPQGQSATRRYFGYFTLGEILLMIAGTLVTAAIIFLVLEFTA